MNIREEIKNIASDPNEEERVKILAKASLALIKFNDLLERKQRDLDGRVVALERRYSDNFDRIKILVSRVSRIEKDAEVSDVPRGALGRRHPEAGTPPPREIPQDVDDPSLGTYDPSEDRRGYVQTPEEFAEQVTTSSNCFVMRDVVMNLLDQLGYDRGVSIWRRALDD